MPYTDPEKRREYQRTWVARNRAEFFRDKSCMHCGSSEQLELDHIDRTSKVDHVIWSWSVERRRSEIAKCQILCRSCHARKTRENKEHPRGSEVSWSVLTESDVLAARRLYASGQWTFRQLADRFNVKSDTLRKAVKGISWKHL